MRKTELEILKISETKKKLKDIHKTKMGILLYKAKKGKLLLRD